MVARTPFDIYDLAASGAQAAVDRLQSMIAVPQARPPADVAARMQREEAGDVAVMDLAFGEILVPLKQLVFAADA